MQSNLKTAILHFLANEFQMEPELIHQDLNFQADLGLTAQGVADLLQRLQEALDLPLPEEKFSQIHTLEDLFQILDIEIEEE